MIMITEKIRSSHDTLYKNDDYNICTQDAFVINFVFTFFHFAKRGSTYSTSFFTASGGTYPK